MSPIILTSNPLKHAMWFLAFIFVSFCGFFFSIFFFPYDPIFSDLFVISGIFLVLMIIPLIFIDTQSKDFMNSVENQQFPENLDNLNVDHDAFIIARSRGLHSIWQIAGIDNLIERFWIEKYPFKIYCCDSRQEIESVLRNDNAKFIWIFGHGWKGGVYFKRSVYFDTAIFHTEVTPFAYQGMIGQEIESKNFIAQLHCNDESRNYPNITLPEVLMDNPNETEYYVTDGDMNPYAVWFATRNLALKIRRTPILQRE